MQKPTTNKTRGVEVDAAGPPRQEAAVTSPRPKAIGSRPCPPFDVWRTNPSPWIHIVYIQISSIRPFTYASTRPTHVLAYNTARAPKYTHPPGTRGGWHGAQFEILCSRAAYSNYRGGASRGAGASARGERGGGEEEGALRTGAHVPFPADVISGGVLAPQDSRAGTDTDRGTMASRADADRTNTRTHKTPPHGRDTHTHAQPPHTVQGEFVTTKYMYADATLALVDALTTGPGRGAQGAQDAWSAGGARADTL